MVTSNLQTDDRCWDGSQEHGRTTTITAAVTTTTIIPTKEEEQPPQKRPLSWSRPKKRAEYLGAEIARGNSSRILSHGHESAGRKLCFYYVLHILYVYFYSYHTLPYVTSTNQPTNHRKPELIE